MHLRYWVFTSIFFLASSLAHPADPPPSGGIATVADAAAAFDAKDWPRAAVLYGQLSVTAPNPRIWYRFGVALRSIGEHDKALAAFDSGMKVGLPAFQAEFGKATVYAATKEPEKAFDMLQKALEHGFSTPAQLSGDEALASLKGDPRFAAMIAHATRNQQPCANRAENRQFDFWLGEWDAVTTAGGMPAGLSKIELILGDCVVLENWQSLGTAYAGKSYNTYDSALKRWEQFWVDNVGGKVFFYGGLKDGVMDYWTDDIPQPDGTMMRRHLQFFKLGPDKVRQFSQRSGDGGKTWAVEYDFTYNRKK